MKVLFANPAYRIILSPKYERYFFCVGSRCPWSLIKRREFYPRYCMFPFFMAYTAALLEKNHHEVYAIDAVPLNMSDEEFIGKTIKFSPDIILFEPTTVSFNSMIELIKIIKSESSAIIVLTGPHVSVYYKEILTQYSFIDYVIIGEYEFVFCNLVEYLNNKYDINKIDGLAYRDKRNNFVLQKKKFYMDINKLPFPSRHLFPIKEKNDLSFYYDGFCQNRPAVQMHSSRGCPFLCNFCLWPQTMYKPHLYRTFNTQRIIDEMKLVINKYGAKEIYFDDDTFTASKEHVLNVCEAIKKNKIYTPWSVMGDAINTDEEMIYAMKDAGCIGVKFGMESANCNILRKINKPIKLSKLKKLIDLCSRLRLKTHISVSFGHIGEKRETIKETLDFVSNLDSDSIQFSLATPYPGTLFFKEAKELNILSHEKWEQFDPTNQYVINNLSVSRDYLIKLEAKSHRYWLKKKILRPKWVIRQFYFLFYILKRQGVLGFFFRIKRAMMIFFSKKFR